MDRKLYYLEGTIVQEMHEHPYKEEKNLQQIIADNPSLISRAWNGKDHELYLVCQEQKAQAPEDDTNSFSLDILLIDDEGVPILVEVKRSTDTRIRREVVAQMLDYACRVSSWNVEDLKELFFLNNSDIPVNIDDEFWEKVAANIRSGHLRLAFVADEIPDTLRILIEFLDWQMKNIDVYGAEIKQFKSENKTLLSSNIVGNSIDDPRKTASSLKAPPRSWTKNEFMDLIDQRGLSNLKGLVCRIMDSFELKEGAEWTSGTGSKYPAFHAKIQGLRIFDIEVASRKETGNYCAVFFDTSTLPTILESTWSAEYIKEKMLSFPSCKWAKEKHYVWGDTKKWLYIDLRSLRNEQDVSVFMTALEELSNAIRKEESQ